MIKGCDTMQTIYIFGHKVPDTDSVCASIALSYLKNQQGLKTEPRLLGELNKETKFVLNYFNFPEPKFLNDVKVQLRNMHYNKNAMINEHVSIYTAYRKMIDMSITGIPLIDDDKKLTGYINMKEVSKYLIDGDITKLDTSYQNIIESLNANEVLRFDEEIKGNIIAAAYKSATFLDKVTLKEDDILIVGDRYRIQDYAVSSKIKLVILVNNIFLPEDLLEKARQNKVNVISVPMGTFKVANMVKLCNYVKLLKVVDSPVTFDITDYRDDFVEISSKLGHTNYPVVNKKNICLGMISIIDINNYIKKQVILVDHNQATQSVDGLEEANILEVIDHHNVSTLGTTTPINFRIMPVGSTCTIIYQLYNEAHIEIPSNIAGIMLSAILSDTLIFKSPTTTDMDKIVAEKLAVIANLNIQEYSTKMFKAASSVEGMSIDEMIHSDMKSYNFDNSSLAIGTLVTLDFDEINRRKQDIIESLNHMCSFGNYKIAIFFVTDIIKNGSYIFYNEESKPIIEEAYGIENILEGTYLDGVVSRKKQMLPPLLELDERK